MKKCAVCEAEIASDLEEFGDPREPVCARCWLNGDIPGHLIEDRIKELREEIRECENYLSEQYGDLGYYDENYENLDEDDIRYVKGIRDDIEGTEERIKECRTEIRKLQTPKKVFEKNVYFQSIVFS